MLQEANALCVRQNARFLAQPEEKETVAMENVSEEVSEEKSKSQKPSVHRITHEIPPHTPNGQQKRNGKSKNGIDPSLSDNEMDCMP